LSPFRQTTVSGFAAIALRGEELEVAVVPAVGMKLTNLRRPRGREWLWRNDQMPLAHPRPEASFVETADSGGWDECFPTVAPSPVPGAPAGTPPLPDHGELWSAAWTSSVYGHASGTTLTATAAGRILPYEFHRELTVDPHEPLLNVQPGTTLELPTMYQVKVDAVHGNPELSRGDIVSWPTALGGDQGRLVLPDSGAWAVKLFGDLGASGRMILTDPRRGERLEMTVRPEAVPQVGIWINYRGWAPAGREPYFNLGLEPAIGAPDSLEEAVEEWKTAQTLAPGEARIWDLEVRLLEEGES
jgi:hypothetical protein